MKGQQTQIKTKTNKFIHKNNTLPQIWFISNYPRVAEKFQL